MLEWITNYLGFTGLMILWIGTVLTGVTTLFFGFFHRTALSRMPDAVMYGNLLDKNMTLQAENNELSDDINHKKANVESLENEFRDLERDRNTMAKQKEDLELDVERLVGERDQLEPFGVKYAELKKDYSEMESVFEKLTQEKQVAETGLDRLKKELTEHESRIQSKKDEFVKLSEQIDEGLLQLNGVNDSLVKGKAEQASLENATLLLRQEKERTEGLLDKEREEYNEFKTLHAELKGEVESLGKQIDKYTEILKALKQEVEIHGGDVGEDKTEEKAQRALQGLWKPVFIRSKSNNETSEFRSLEHLSKRLVAKDYVFHPRVINAFHTTLKVQDMSPLVVLAGISGTGKSLLPKEYAESMGMHYLGMPVQPSWDSPDDILGFYNYIEKNYNATEFARAMVQFDVYNKNEFGEAKGRIELSDQMMLVLFDEMNLARVEYYFSEFLSKLETRRTIDPGDQESRRKAEITIKNPHKDIHVYPGRNIVFVGTMNEDESTQTLSDKVLDRASVLRFGKPKDTHSRGSGNQGGVEKNSKRRVLDYSIWEKWLGESANSLNNEENDRVTTTIGELNDAMDMLGKPFGHRISQSIHAYVSHYPNNIQGARESRINYALADQVEQRILPKLRGLDVSEHGKAFTKVQKIIEQLDDAMLLQAFKSGRDVNDGSMQGFLWRGIDRNEGKGS